MKRAAIFFAIWTFAIPALLVDAAGPATIFDDHEHIVLEPAQTKSLIDTMDRFGIASMVLLDTPDITFDPDAGFEGYDDTVIRQLAMKRQYPDRLRVFYTFPSDDGAGPRNAALLAAQGIDGLKFYNGLPMLRDQLGSIDSPAMYAAYAVAREHKLPVIIHVEALSPIQRREFERALNDFPGVTFICPHLCGVQSSLEILATMLAKHPNLYTDGGPWHRVGAFVTIAPDKFREFYIAHSNRIMFATDSVKQDSLDRDPDLGEVIECERQLLEAKYFSCFRSDLVMRGLYLPQAALDDIYFKTAARIFPPPARVPRMLKWKNHEGRNRQFDAKRRRKDYASSATARFKKRLKSAPVESSATS
ncbi:MAG TPA: amidohydrolase family protein [Candidatus Binataceae bacterium]|nr:amidohydrolase family protein [Candidatus Binataceae bacterium]